MAHVSHLVMTKTLSRVPWKAAATAAVAVTGISTGTTASAALSLPDSFGPDDALFTVGPGEMYWLSLLDGTFGPVTDTQQYLTPNLIFVGVDPMNGGPVEGPQGVFFGFHSDINDYSGALPKPFVMSNFSAATSIENREYYAFPLSVPLGDDLYRYKFEIPETVKYLPGGTISFDPLDEANIEDKGWWTSGLLLSSSTFENGEVDEVTQYGILADTSGVWYSDSNGDPSQPRGYVGFARLLENSDETFSLADYGYLDVSYDTSLHTVTVHGFNFQPIPEAGPGIAAAAVLLGGSVVLYARRRRVRRAELQVQ